MQTEASTLVAFRAISTKLSPESCLDGLGFALVECVECCRTQFGYPNDEGLPEHALYDQGLSEVEGGVVEVLNSFRVAAVEEQMTASARRIHKDRYRKSKGPPLRHFLFLFKDNTFECVCRDLKLLSVGKTYEQTMAEASQRIAIE